MRHKLIHEQYGAHWQEVKQEVPYKLIPYVY